MQKKVAQATATAGDYEMECRAIWPDGSVHWIEIRARVVKQGLGKPAKMIGVSLETTERKQLEQALAARVAERTWELALSERRFRAIFDSALQMAMLVDLDGRVVVANRTSLDAAGLTDVAGCLLWENPWWAGTPAEAERLREEFVQAAAGAFVRREAELTFGDGERRIFDFSLKPVLDDGSAVAQVVAEARDITELKRTEATLRQSQKLEAIGQLTGGVAHDFNNLLMAVVANLDLLDRRAVAMRGCADSSTAPSRAPNGRSPHAAPAGLRAPAGGCSLRAWTFTHRCPACRLLEQSVGPQISCGSRAAPAPGWYSLTQPIRAGHLNLALNARDAMPDGGTFTILFDETGVPANDPSGLQPGSYLRLRARDTGVGMDDQTLKRATEPFFSTKGIGKGTGLGLSMVHGLAVQSGGCLRHQHRGPGHHG